MRGFGRLACLARGSSSGAEADVVDDVESNTQATIEMSQTGLDVSIAK